MSGEATTQLTQRTTRAALNSGLGELVKRVLAVVLAIVTARTLEPREVGLLGVTVIVIGVISMIGYYPEIAAVAARGSSEHNRYALAALTLRAVVVASLLSAAALTLPMLAKHLVGNDQAIDDFRKLLAILIWIPILEWVGGYPQVVLQRQLDLRYLTLAHGVQPVLFVGLATILLLSGKGFTAVAWANVIGTAGSFLLFWFRLLRRRSLRFEGWPTGAIWRNTTSGSLRVLVGGFGGYLGGRLDNLLVAAALGPTAM